MKLTVNLKENSYPIYIENGILNRAGEYIADLFHGQRIMIVSDDNVFPLYGKQLCDSLSGYECHSLVLPHGEPTKSFDTLPKVYSAMLDAKLTRSDLVIALGGGVIGDLTTSPLPDCADQHQQPYTGLHLYYFSPETALHP